MKILFLGQLFPLPQDSGGKIKSFHTVKALASEHELHLLTYIRGENECACLDDMRKICASVNTVDLKRGKLTQLVDAVANALSGRSFIINRDFRVDMRDAVERLVKEITPDAVHVDHLQMAQFLPDTADYKVILDQHNVESTIIRRVSKTATSLLAGIYAAQEWPKLLKFELDACRRADVVLTVSDQDREELLGLEPAIRSIHTLGIGVDTNYLAPVERLKGSKNLLSIATMHWPPNIDAITYFYQKILPIIRQNDPEAVLTIAGQQPPGSIQSMASDYVKVTGYVADVREASRDCGIFIVPLRSGSGVRVKILNALSMALPVVSTSVGAEGIEVEHGKHLLIADDPEDFAAACVKLLNEPQYADQLGENGRDLVCDKYSWNIIGKRLLDIYDEWVGCR